MSTQLHSSSSSKLHSSSSSELHSSSSSSSSEEEEEEIEQQNKFADPGEGEKEKIDQENDQEQGQEEGEVSLSQTTTIIKRGETTIIKRVFTDEDEIVLLEGLSDFWAEGRTHAWIKFRHFMAQKKSLSTNFTENQISEKIRRLRRKFLENFRRGIAKNGDFGNPHQSLVFELSKRLWENDLIGSSSRSKRTKTRTKKASRKRDDDDEDVSKKTSKKQKQVVADDFDFSAEFPMFSALVDSFRCSFIKKEFGPSSRKALGNTERECSRLIGEQNQLLLDLMNLRVKQIALVRSGLEDEK